MDYTYYGIFDTSGIHWEYAKGMFFDKEGGEKAADEMRGYWKERYVVLPLSREGVENFNKEGIKEIESMDYAAHAIMETKENLDTWGVWDNDKECWLEDFTDYKGRLHKRQNINYNHAVNAAYHENQYFSDRYEARDMTAYIKTVVDEGPVKKSASIQEMIDDRRGTIAHIEQEIYALEMTLMLMGEKM